MITFKITILAHRSVEEHNTFAIEIIFRWNTNILFTHLIEASRIVFGHLWPNPYYQTPEEETAHTLSRVSLATGVTASQTTPVNTPSPPSTPENLPQIELPAPF